MSKINIQGWRANIFLAYVRRDIPLMEKLMENMDQLIRINYVENIWKEGMIEKYKDWNENIVGLMEKADFIVLFISKELLYSGILEYPIFYKYRPGQNRRPRFIYSVIARDCNWKETIAKKFFTIPKYGKPLRYSKPDDASKIYGEIVGDLKKRILAARVEKEMKFVRDSIKIVRPQEEIVDEDYVLLNKNLELLKEQVRMQNHVLEDLYKTIEKKISHIEQQLEPELADREKLIKVFGKNDPSIQVVDQKIDQLYMVQREYNLLKDHFDRLLRKLKPYYNGHIDGGK